MLIVYEKIEPELTASAALEKVKAMRADLELDFLRKDIHALMSESKEGILRVRKIVQDLKDFSRIDASQEWQWSNLHDGIDSTLNIVNNEVKYKADLFKEYGAIPDIECLPSQINQVILNLVVNAAHAIQSGRGKITIRTGSDSECVWIEVIDSGSGIAKENMTRIFDPFFTTKPVGQGTGLGLSLSYGIIQKHRGEIQVDSSVGEGSTFKVILPIRQIAP
jgi:signal transduction histidine kinase